MSDFLYQYQIDLLAKVAKAKGRIIVSSTPKSNNYSFDYLWRVYSWRIRADKFGEKEVVNFT